MTLTVELGDVTGSKLFLNKATIAGLQFVSR